MDTKVFYKLSYGLYIIGSTQEGKFNGQVANTVFQLTSEPYTVAISINKNNLTNEFIKASKVFSVSILPQSAALDFIGHFGFKSGRDIAKYETVAFKQGVTGAPVLLEQAVGYLEAEVIQSLDVGTHTLFIGQVKNAEMFTEEEPMTYAHYQLVKRGLVPPVAPAYIKAEKKTDSINAGNTPKKYECTVCGYIYDPERGDPDSGIKPGTAFSDIPDDWVCPICGVAKSQFRELE